MPNGLILRFAWPAATLLLLTVASLIAFALFRHAARRSHQRRVLELGREVQPALLGLLAGSIGYDEALRPLRALETSSRTLEKWLMTHRNLPADQIPVLRRLCEDLGLVLVWRRRLLANRPPARSGHLRCRDFLRRSPPLAFVSRAEAAENLGLVRHWESWPLLVEALDDPHVTVRSVAARALSRIGDPESFSRLAERLRSAAVDPTPPISKSALKMALAAFPLSQALRLREFLEDPCGQVRSLAAGVVLSMVEREAAADYPEATRESFRLEPDVAEIFFGRLAFDENAEVRARAADVAGYVDESRCLPLLMALENDPAWFVRLRAVKALSRQRRTPLSAMGHRLTDPNWSVREAAAEGLCMRGQTGVGALLDHFATTTDRYSREQIAEQIGRAGLLPSFLEKLRDPNRNRERRFIEGMVRMGKGKALLATLRDAASPTWPEDLRNVLSPTLDPAMNSLA